MSETQELVAVETVRPESSSPSYARWQQTVRGKDIVSSHFEHQSETRVWLTDMVAGYCDELRN